MLKTLKQDGFTVTTDADYVWGGNTRSDVKVHNAIVHVVDERGVNSAEYDVVATRACPPYNMKEERWTIRLRAAPYPELHDEAALKAIRVLSRIAFRAFDQIEQSLG